MKLSKETQREKKMTPWFITNPKSISFLSSFLLFSFWLNLGTHSSLTKENPTSTLSFLNETKTMKLETFFFSFSYPKMPISFSVSTLPFPPSFSVPPPILFPVYSGQPLTLPTSWSSYSPDG